MLPVIPIVNVTRVDIVNKQINKLKIATIFISLLKNEVEKKSNESKSTVHLPSLDNSMNEGLV